MNSLQTTNPTMTVKEVAEILGVTERTIQRHLKNIRQNTDNVVGHGKLSLLNQEEVTKIKIKIQESGRTDLRNVAEVAKINTDLEMIEKTADVMGWLKSKYDNFKAENDLLKPKAELADAVLRDKKKHYCIRDAGKLLGLNQTQMYNLLREKGLVTKGTVPSQKALDYKVLTLRVNHVGKKSYPQSIMTMENIQNFRTRYFPKREAI